MITYILIIWFANTGVTSIDGFKHLNDCLEAQESLVRNSTAQNVHSFCVEVKR